MASIKGIREEAHALRRGQERHGLTSEDLKQMSDAIHANKSMFMGKASPTRSYHLIKHGYRSYLVIYEKRRHTIVTVLPDGYRIRGEYNE